MIGFIGAGKVGCSLGKYFKSHEQEISGYFSRTYNSAKDAADFTDTEVFSDLPTLIHKSDTLFITVNDGSIHDVWEQVRQYDIKGKTICHCSGLLTSKIFDGITETGAFGLSVHMLYAISDKYKSYDGLSDAIFTIEGDEPSCSNMISMLKSTGNKALTIEAHNKAKYHAAAACASNLMVALSDMSASMLCECGFSYDEAQELILPLIVGNAHNMQNQGIINALTGPIERNDAKTVLKHINCISGDKLNVYIMLSKMLTEVAKKKHPENDYSDLTKELTEYEKHSRNN